MRYQKPSRRTVLKAIGGTSAIVSAAGVSSAETRQSTTETPPESPFDFEYRTVGDDVKDAVGHLWWLLTIDRDRIDELLAKSSLSTNATRRKQETVNELRSTYKVELERDEQNERELTYHLVEETARPLHETEIGRNTLESPSSGKEAVESVAESVGAGLRREAGPSIGPTHKDQIHGEMGVGAVAGTEYDNEDVTDKLESGSIAPDGWPKKCQVCSEHWLSLGDRFDLIDISLDLVEEEVRKAIQAINDKASPHHMYVPGGEEFKVTGILSAFVPPWINLLKVELEGAAPRDAQAHWENATSGYGTDFTELGYAFHFLQDLSHPLHTGAIGPQVLDTRGPIHDAYMNFIVDNWGEANDGSEDLIDEFDWGMWDPRWYGSMEETCKAMANNASSYSEQVYETIVNNGPNNRDDWDDIVENSAIDCMYLLGSCSRGAINQL